MSDDVQITRSPRWMRIALVLSLAANLAVAGLVAGALIRGGPVAQLAGPGGEFRVLERALPEAPRAALRADLRTRRAEFRAQRQELEGLRDALLASLRAQPFDPAAFDAVLTAQRDFWQGVGTSAQAVLRARVSEMSDADRAAFADNLERWRDRMAERRRERDERREQREP